MKLAQMIAVPLALIATLAAAPPPADDSDVADVPVEALFVRGNPAQRYFLIGSGEGAEAPQDGCNLLVVLPGGDGGAHHLPFVRRLYKNALGGRYLVAQLVAHRWTDEQKTAWPTGKDRLAGAQFTTEEFVAAVVGDVAERRAVNSARVFVLGWDSGGPAAYSAALTDGTPVKGTFVAMSPFKATRLPPLKAAAGVPFCIYHSAEDEVYPFGMVKGARFILMQNGAKVRLMEYEGGHGWHGNVYDDLQRGLAWVETAARESAPVAADAAEPPAQKPAGDDARVLLHDGFEQGLQRPNGWDKGHPQSGIECTWDKGNAYKGERSLCLRKAVNTKPASGTWNRTLSHDRHHSMLRIGVWARAEGVSKAVVDVQFVNRNQQRTGQQEAVHIGSPVPGGPPVSHDWRYYQGTVRVPGGTRALNVRLKIASPGTVWFDEITAAYVE